LETAVLVDPDPGADDVQRAPVVAHPLRREGLFDNLGQPGLVVFGPSHRRPAGDEEGRWTSA
jgi:hypothetical protein